jgi:hypothetical protein
MTWNQKEYGDRPFVKAPIDHVTHQFLGKKIPYRTRFTEKYRELQDRAKRANGSLNFAKKQARIDKGKMLRKWGTKERLVLKEVNKLMSKVNRGLSKARKATDLIRFTPTLSREKKEELINATLKSRNDTLNSTYVRMIKLLKQVEEKGN